MHYRKYEISLVIVLGAKLSSGAPAREALAVGRQSPVFAKTCAVEAQSLNMPSNKGVLR
jgi:hypothetical protein